MSQVLLFLALLPFVSAGAIQKFFHIGHVQAAGVNGTLLCNGKPAHNIEVRLYDEDSKGESVFE